VLFHQSESLRDRGIVSNVGVIHRLMTSITGARRRLSDAAGNPDPARERRRSGDRVRSTGLAAPDQHHRENERQVANEHPVQQDVRNPV
jgi:hypothetical protein